MLAFFGLLLTAIIWGATFIFIKQSVAEVDVYYFLFLRFLVASSAMTLVFMRRLRRIDKETLRASFVLGVLMSGSYIFQTVGIQYTTASNSSLITGLYTVLVPFCMVVFLKKKVSPGSIIGATIAFSGLYFLTQYSWTGFNVGDAITLMCALSIAWHIIMTGKYARKHDTALLVLLQLVFVMLVCGGGVLIRGVPSYTLPPVVIGTILYTAIFATVCTFMIQTAAQKFIDPTRTGIIMAMEAVFGVFFAWLVGGEILTTVASIGAILMILGIIISEISGLIKKQGRGGAPDQPMQTHPSHS